MSKDVNTSKPKREDYERAMQSMGTFIDVEVGDLMTMAERAQQFAAQRTTESMKVSRVMSHPVRVIQPQTSLSEAAHLMVSERISGLPVVDETEKLIGIITEADFLRGLGVPAHHPSHSLWQTLEAMFTHLPLHGELEGPDEVVSSYMVHDVVCALPDDHVDEVIAKMKRYRVKRIPVCNDERHVVGIVTRSDLVRIFFDRYLRGSQPG